MKQKHCVVIGAGLAGLAAAYELTLRHWKVTVLEAGDRLGGRVLSHRFHQAPHLVCELGGEWIGQDHHEMRRLCCAFDLELMDHRFCNSFMEKGHPQKRRQKKISGVYGPGEWCMSGEARRIFDKFTAEYPKMRKRQLELLDKRDWWTELQLRGFSRDDLLRRDLMDSTDFGESIRQTSAYLAAGEYISADGSGSNATDEMDSKIVGGNSNLVHKLKHAVGKANIGTKFEVNRITQSRSRVTVHGKGKGWVDADACICTVPAHFLRKIVWDPEPKTHLEASKELQYARITKTVVLCAKRFWKMPHAAKGGFAVFTDLASDFCFDSTYLQPGKMGILCSYAIGEKADDIDGANETELGDWIARDVAAAYAKKVNPIAAKRKSWSQDLFTGGAYAFYRPGQWFDVREKLARTHRRVHFAGEHLSDNWQGFMEGAVETGRAAAEAVA